jgi:hypothetical protein
MIDPRTEAVLQEIVRRESRSVLSYVGDAFPWTTARESAALPRLSKLVAEERQAVAELALFLTRRHVTLPYLGSYPNAFTTINFIALDYLLPRLVDFEGQSIADLERDLARLTDPEARAKVEKLLEVKRRHLPILKSLNTPQPEPATA